MFYKLILFLFMFSLDTVNSMNNRNHNRPRPVAFRINTTGQHQGLVPQNIGRTRRFAMTDQQVRRVIDDFSPEERERRN